VTACRNATLRALEDSHRYRTRVAKTLIVAGPLVATLMPSSPTSRNWALILVSTFADGAKHPENPKISSGNKHQYAEYEQRLIPRFVFFCVDL
jgi:hypothetical protein